MKKDQRVRNIVICVLAGLIITSVISFTLLRLLIPCDSVKSGFLVTINGQVKTELNETSHYPNYVRAYYPYYNLQILGERADVIDLANISWERQKGNFSMTFWLPIEMEIILTADATGCNHVPLYVSLDNNVHQVELVFDGGKCYKELDVPDTKEETIKEAQRLLDEAYSGYTDQIFKDNGADSIYMDVKLGGEEIKGINREADEVLSTLHTYTAYWLGLRAHYKMESFRLKACIDKSLPLLTSNESCIVLPYNEKIGLLSANISCKSFSDSWILRENVHEIMSVDEAKKNIITTANEWRNIRMIAGNCERDYEIIKKSYENQKEVCNMRNGAFVLLKLSQVFALFCFGLIMYDPIRRMIIK